VTQAPPQSQSPRKKPSTNIAISFIAVTPLLRRIATNYPPDVLATCNLAERNGETRSHRRRTGIKAVFREKHCEDLSYRFLAPPVACRAAQSIGSANRRERGRCASDLWGVVSLSLINSFAKSRTKPNMNPPTAVPYITEAGSQAQLFMA
jgi:hypothetical protein